MCLKGIPLGAPGQCHWMGLIIGNKNMYVLGVGLAIFDVQASDAFYQV